MTSSIMQGSHGSTQLPRRQLHDPYEAMIDMPTHGLDRTQPPSQVDPTPTHIETGQSSTGGFGQMMMRMMKLKV